MDGTSSIEVFSPLEINSVGGNRIEVYAGLTKKNNGYKLAGFEHLNAAGGFGEMGFHHFAGDGFDIWYSNYMISENVKFLARGNFPALELHIPFNSHFISWWDGQREMQLRDKQFELSYFPFINSKSAFFGGRQYATFDIHYSAAYLKKFSNDCAPLSKFLEKVERGEPASLLGSAQFLSPEMIRLVMGMLSCEMPLAMAPYFYESSAQLMLIQVLDRLNNLSENDIHYSTHDLDRAMAAKEIIISDFSKKYSIAELAHLTGFNEWKLQHSFKHLFGATIFDYGQASRLEHAKFLLLTTNEQIHSIAIQCGYPDHPNLTAAFKKKFGFTPEYCRAHRK